MEKRTWNYQVCIKEQTKKGEIVHTLFFSDYQKVPWEIGRDMSGCQYHVRGRVYTDVVSLKRKELQQFSEDVRAYEDCYGNKVLAFYTHIPTFDASDRDWDSLHADYLLFDGEEFVLISCKSGYCIAEIGIYSGLVSAGRGMRSWFKKMRWKGNLRKGWWRNV